MSLIASDRSGSIICPRYMTSMLSLRTAFTRSRRRLAMPDKYGSISVICSNLQIGMQDLLKSYKRIKGICGARREQEWLDQILDEYMQFSHNLITDYMAPLEHMIDRVRPSWLRML